MTPDSPSTADSSATGDSSTIADSGVASALSRRPGSESSDVPVAADSASAGLSDGNQDSWTAGESSVEWITEAASPVAWADSTAASRADSDGANSYVPVGVVSAGGCSADDGSGSGCSGAASATGAAAAFLLTRFRGARFAGASTVGSAVTLSALSAVAAVLRGDRFAVFFAGGAAGASPAPASAPSDPVVAVGALGGPAGRVAARRRRGGGVALSPPVAVPESPGLSFWSSCSRSSIQTPYGTRTDPRCPFIRCAGTVPRPRKPPVDRRATTDAPAVKNLRSRRGGEPRGKSAAASCHLVTTPSRAGRTRPTQFEYPTRFSTVPPGQPRGSPISPVTSSRSPCRRRVTTAAARSPAPGSS